MYVRRIVELPSRGRLIAATDLQGNLADMLRVEQVFEQAAAEPDGAVLVITGDLVHGPEISESQWPPYLGSFFEGDSVAVLECAEQLQQRHPGRVHFLLGNHEHAHLGGPVVAKFFPDEARRLESLLGIARSAEVRRWFASWPLVAIARHSGLLMVHAAPAARLECAAELDALELEPPHGITTNLNPILTQLLWSRSTTTARARAFLNVFDPALKVAVFGHDVAREGFAIDREPLLCISTSFGCFDGDKLYLDWDLAHPAESAARVAKHGLRPLYPEAPPVYRDTSPRAGRPTPCFPAGGRPADAARELGQPALERAALAQAALVEGSSPPPARNDSQAPQSALVDGVSSDA